MNTLTINARSRFAALRKYVCRRETGRRGIMETYRPEGEERRERIRETRREIAHLIHSGETAKFVLVGRSGLANPKQQARFNAFMRRKSLRATFRWADKLVEQDDSAAYFRSEDGSHEAVINGATLKTLNALRRENGFKSANSTTDIYLPSL